MQNGGNPETTVQKSRPVRLIVRDTCLHVARTIKK
jgi:hypothetical protein